jgi:hypothetical protein
MILLGLFQNFGFWNSLYCPADGEANSLSANRGPRGFEFLF